MPSATHPWMNPLTQTRLWPHECGPIYQAYNRIFDCRGHGWSNLQSTHINLPFDGDEQFGRLHAAIRLLMPIMPALTASSPIVDGIADTHLDSRMRFYCSNSARIPQVAGEIIPEQAFTRKSYREQIFEPMFQAIALLDPEGILADEFLNSRGAIARFDRGAIEIRVLDIQEAPAADLAAAQLIVSSLRHLTEEREAFQDQRSWKVGPLARIFQDVIRDADRAIITDENYLAIFGLGPKPISAGDLWRHIAGTCLDTDSMEAPLREALNVMLDTGPLARRILAALAGDIRREHLKEIYQELCDCLAKNRLFIPS